MVQGGDGRSSSSSPPCRRARRSRDCFRFEPAGGLAVGRGRRERPEREGQVRGVVAADANALRAGEIAATVAGVCQLFPLALATAKCCGRRRC